MQLTEKVDCDILNIGIIRIGGIIMTLENNAETVFTESDCLNLIQYVSEILASDNAESAVPQVITHMRELFSLPCVSVREIIPRPCSLRFVYESLNDSAKKKRINETITYTENNWKRALDIYSQGYYLYERKNGAEPLDIVGGTPNPPSCMLQIPMFCGGDFLGTVDFVEFDSVHGWSDREISVLKICCSMLCQQLYRTNEFFMLNTNRNEFDPITGLISFNSLNARLEENMPKMLEKSPVALVYTDIHHFKYINETYGYKKGDELLKIAAAAMLVGKEINPDLMLCRVHSDNFVSVAPIEEDKIPLFEKYITEQNNKICELLSKSCPDVRIRLNTGICYVYSTDTEAATAIANANLARKLAKRENLRSPAVFADAMMEDIKYQEYLNNELPKAIADHDLKVYYQPKINCSDDSLYGAEALVRWQQPDGTFIYPDKFIPLFEKNGSIVDVDFYVYREVFKYLRRRIDAGLPTVPISMNVSRVHFRSDAIIPYIKSLLDEYEIPPELLEFELTENIYIKNFSKANEFIKTCRSMNIKVSMDDFGSGYSSLNVMSALPIDTLKIDRVFLKNDELNSNDKTVLECMISMAKRLGMNVICEGVETRSQSVFLKNVNCDMIQGYYYGRPMNEESFSEFTMDKLG